MNHCEQALRIRQLENELDMYEALIGTILRRHGNGPVVLTAEEINGNIGGTLSVRMTKDGATLEFIRGKEGVKS